MVAIAGVTVATVDQVAAVAVAEVTTIALVTEERCGGSCRPVAFFR